MESSNSIDSCYFQRISFCTHITALKVFKDYLFIGEGNEVQLYNWISNRFVYRENIFDGCSIHGIRFNENSEFLFFGDKYIITLPILFLMPDVRLGQFSPLITLKDWIFDVQWIKKPEEKDNIIAALTAHNCLVLLKKTGDIISTYQCAENCILYSASFFSSEYESYVLAVGTVFQKILLWSPFLNRNDVDRSEPFQQLSGHQGVIFSVTYNADHQIICSTSDDRSLRIWKVRTEDEYITSLDFWKNATIEQIHVLYAHQSRVWRSFILDSCILSVGEDSLICVWSLDGKLLNKLNGHKNGSIWSIEIAYSPDDCKDDCMDDVFAFTGGSDGGVYVWNITEALQPISILQLSKESGTFKSYLNNQSTDDETNDDEDIFTSNKIKQKTSNFPKLCSLYMENNLENIIVYMGTKNLSMYNLESKSWEDIYIDESISHYCTVSTSSGNPYIALGNFTGELILLNMEEYHEDMPVSKKTRIYYNMIYSLHWCNTKYDTLLSCGRKGILSLWKIDYDGDFVVEIMKHFYLPQGKNHWRSTAALYLNKYRSLIVGDRCGSIIVYHNPEEEKEVGDTIQTFKSVHGENGVTDLQANSGFVYSSGRDGKVIQFILEGKKLIRLHTLKVSNELEWIGRIIFHKKDILLAGFHTNNFVLWSTHLDCSVLSVECGGGHRCWDFNIREDSMATFTAIQKKDIIYCQRNLVFPIEYPVVKEGLTGQKICCLTFLGTEYVTDNEPMSVVACGGEDNILRIIGLVDLPNETTNYIPISSLSGHISSIRAIAKQNLVNVENKFLIASVGGRSQINLWTFKYYTDGSVCHHVYTAQLLGSNEKSKSKNKQNTELESQTRLMDVSISRSNDNHKLEIFDIVVACSDSYFRLYRFELESKDFHFKFQFQYDTNCMLKVVNPGPNLVAAHQDISYVIGGTNGSLKILKHRKDDNQSEKMTTLKDVKNCHKSGINALDIMCLIGPIWMICSGGDDTNLMFAFINLNGLPSVTSNIKIVSKYHHFNAHASQITGVKILDQYTIASTSIDQRLKIWKLKYINCPRAKITIVLQETMISLIPDIAHLECWIVGYTDVTTKWNLAVCGQGIEVFVYVNKDKEDFKELMLHFLQDSSIKIA